MKLIEQFLKSKTVHEADCEDRLFLSEHFAAVIDGATSKSSRTYEGASSGKFIAGLLCKALETLSYDSSAEEAVTFLTASVASFYEKHGIVDELKKKPVERASASVAIFSRYRNEIWMVGDCQCLVDRVRYTNARYIDELLSAARSLFLHAENRLPNRQDAATGHDPGRQFIFPLLERESLFQNSIPKNEFTYGIIDGFAVPEEEIKVIRLSGPQTIVLASDGYPKLYASLARSEQYLQKVLREDPQCYKIYKSTKGLKTGNSSFDDRAYLKIKLD